MGEPIGTKTVISAITRYTTCIRPGTGSPHGPAPGSAATARPGGTTRAMVKTPISAQQDRPNPVCVSAQVDHSSPVKVVGSNESGGQEHRVRVPGEEVPAWPVDALVRQQSAADLRGHPLEAAPNRCISEAPQAGVSAAQRHDQGDPSSGREYPRPSWGKGATEVVRVPKEACGIAVFDEQRLGPSDRRLPGAGALGVLQRH
jgi:hypothetical protein